MKHGKKPSVRQCKLMEKYGLNSGDWLVVKDTASQMVLVNRWSDKTTKTIYKEI